MAKQILVKTPLTSDGSNIIFDENDKRTYTESILLDVPGKYGARAILEQRNTTLPPGLRCIITDYVEETVASVVPAPVISALDQLKLKAENEKLQAEIDALKSKKTVANATS
jgi:hypothetical protein